jgi:hypothetical protein
MFCVRSHKGDRFFMEKEKSFLCTFHEKEKMQQKCANVTIFSLNDIKICT